MPAVSDLDINRAIRRILVKHWIDLGRLSIRNTRGAVHVYGLLQKLPGAETELTASVVEAMFFAIKSTRGVTRVTPHLENWSNVDGFWRRIDHRGQDPNMSSRRESARADSPKPGADTDTEPNDS